MKICRFAVASALAACAFASYADTYATFKVEGRGLPVVEGVVRDTPKVEWGFVNFIAFGPGWQYSAQDYAAKEHKKESVTDAKYGQGLVHTAKMWPGGRGIGIREEFFDVSKGGAAKAHVRWTISSLDGAPMKLERAYLRFPLPVDDFAGGTVGGSRLPESYEKEWIGVGDKGSIEVVSRSGAKKLRLSVSSGNAVIADARKDKQDRFELRVEFPGAKDSAKAAVEFDVQGVFADSLKKANGRVALDLPPPPMKLAANDDWCAFPYTNDIKGRTHRLREEPEAGPLRGRQPLLRRQLPLEGGVQGGGERLRPPRMEHGALPPHRRHDHQGRVEQRLEPHDAA